MKDEGGFAPVAFVGNAVKQYRSMQEAPEKAYVKEISLSKELLLAHRDGTTDSDVAGDYFYFKTADGYGKGRVRIDWDSDIGEVRANMTLRLQKYGTRLVATED